MKIEKVVNEKGEVVITIDGKPTSTNTSRALTGTTNEEFWGIFSPDRVVRFSFGNFHENIEFTETPLSIDPIEQYARKLMARVQKVRNWVNKCKGTAGTIEIKELPEVTEKLAKEHRLYYRNSDGQIKPIY